MTVEFTCAGCEARVFSFGDHDGREPDTMCLECLWLAQFPDDPELRALLRPDAPANDGRPDQEPQP